MTWQRRMDVKTYVRNREPHASSKPTDLAGWMISDLTIGYVSSEVVLGKTMKVMVGLTNLTTSDITLHFKSPQKIRLRISDSTGNLVYETPENIHPAPTDETIPATKGAYWSESLDLKVDQFKIGNTYAIDGALVSTNYPGATRVVFKILS